MPRTHPAVVAAATVTLLTAGCSAGGPSDQATASASDGSLSVVPASFDLSVGDDHRFLAGLLTNDRELVVGGEVEMSFFYFGEQPDRDNRELVAETTAAYLPVPGKGGEPAPGTPTVAETSSATGVYATRVGFDRPGTWGVGVSVEVGGRRRTGTATFQVRPEPQVVAVGDPAPRTENATLADDVPPAGLDSRAGSTDAGGVPDPDLHDTTIADAVAAGRPTVVVVSTPVYCQSRFCGPITETIEDLEGTYGDRAEFVHLEVWADFADRKLNAGAAEWMQTEQGANEPWVFLIGDDGTITARWDNVLDAQVLEARLQELEP